MKDLQNLVYKYMEKEKVTLSQALLQSSLGASAKVGDIAETVRGVTYSGYPYNDERKKRTAEHLGELLFHWVMLASTTGFSPEQIMEEYISSYIKRTKIMSDEEIRLRNTRDKMMNEDSKRAEASIIEMLKYVKTPAEAEQEIQEKKLREQIKGK